MVGADDFALMASPRQAISRPAHVAETWPAFGLMRREIAMGRSLRRISVMRVLFSHRASCHNERKYLLIYFFDAESMGRLRQRYDILVIARRPIFADGQSFASIINTAVPRNDMIMRISLHQGFAQPPRRIRLSPSRTS